MIGNGKRKKKENNKERTEKRIKKRECIYEFHGIIENEISRKK